MESKENFNTWSKKYRFKILHTMYHVNNYMNDTLINVSDVKSNKLFYFFFNELQN